MFTELQQTLLELLRGTPPLILVLAVAGAGALVITVLARARAALILVGAMLFMASIGVANFDEGFVRSQWLHPVQAARSELFAAFGIMLGLGAVAHIGLHAERRVPTQSLLLLVIGIYAATLRFAHEGPASGAFSVVMAVVTIVPLLLMIPRLIDDWDDMVRMLRMVAAVNALWLGATFVQMLLDPNAMVIGRQERLFGPTGNPQQAAIILGMNAVLLIWLFNNDWARSLRYVYAVMAGMNAIGVLWTGSRTGMVLFIIGLTLVAYGRIGRTILFLPLGVLGLYLAYSTLGFLGIDLTAASRVTSLQDTRSDQWLDMLASARENPWIGVGIADAGGSENSYLYALASYGVGMVLFVFTLAMASLALCLRLFRLRFSLDAPRRAIIDVVLAYNAMYFIGGLVEGYIMARVSTNLVLLIVFASIATRIVELCTEEATTAATWEDEDGWADEPSASDDETGEDPSSAEEDDPWRPLADPFDRGGPLPGRA